MDENPESVLRQVVDENDGHVSGQSAFIAARRGDPIGQYVCNAYIDYLCAGIVNLVNIFQPDTLAIGGRAAFVPRAPHRSTAEHSLRAG